MSKINRSKMVKKTLLNQNSGYKYFVCVASFICMFVFTLFLTLNETEKKNDIVKAKKVYGNYHYCLQAMNKIDLQEFHDNSKNIINETSVTFQCGKYNDTEIFLAYVDEDLLQNTDMRLTRGEFPRKSNEIAVNKSEMTNIGYSYSELLGKELFIENTDTGQKEKKTITGFYDFPTDEDGYSFGGDSIVILMNKDYIQECEEDAYDVYLECKDSSKAEADLKEMKKLFYDSEYGIYYIEGFVNEHLLYAQGHTEEASYDNRIENIFFYGVVCVIIIFISMTLYSVLDICIAKWSNIINVHKLIGSNMGLVIFCSVKTIVNMIIGGGIIGIIAAIGSVFAANKFSFHWLLSSDVSSITIPYSKIGYMLVGITVLASFVTLMKLSIVNELTASQMICCKECGYDKSNNKIREKIFKKNHFSILKLAIRNVFFYKWRKLLIMLCIVISVAMMLIMYTRIEKEKEYPDNNYAYSYVISVIDYYSPNFDKTEQDDLEQIYSKIENACKENNTDIYYFSEVFDKKYRLKKESITESMRKKLLSRVESKNQLVNNNDYVELEAAVMGYSKEMVTELCEVNGIDSITLNGNDAIILDRTLNRNNTIVATFNPKVGEQSTFFRKFDEFRLDATFVGKVRNAIIYPEKEGCYLCVIIDKEIFREKYLNGYIMPIYLKDVNDELRDELYDLCTSSKYLRFINQDEKLEEMKNAHYHSIVLYSVVFFMCVVCVFINLLLIAEYEADIRKHEFALLKGLGIDVFTQKYLCVVENALIYILGIIGGLGVTKYILVILYGNQVINSDKTPLKITIICISFFAFCMLFAIMLAYRKRNNCILPDDLIEK